MLSFGFSIVRGSYVSISLLTNVDEYPNGKHIAVVQSTKRMLFAGLLMLFAVIALYIFFFYVHFTVRLQLFEKKGANGR